MPAYRLYGVRLDSDHTFRLPLWVGSSGAELTLEYAAGTLAEPPERYAAYRSPLKTPDGESVSVLYRVGDDELLCFPPDDRFLLTGTHIFCPRPADRTADLFEIRFLGALMAYWLERHRVLALHASAVEIDGRAVAFLAGHGGGKTSLAASFLAAGHRLLTDDLLAVEQGAREPRACAGYPVMRMARDLMERFAVGRSTRGRVHPRAAKWLVPVELIGGGFQPDSLPLSAVFVLRAGPPERALKDWRASGPRAVVELVRCSFSPYILEAVGLQPDRLERLAALVEAVPVRVLEYPAGLARLQEVRREVLAELARLARDKAVEGPTEGRC